MRTPLLTIGLLLPSAGEGGEPIPWTSPREDCSFFRGKMTPWVQFPTFDLLSFRRKCGGYVLGVALVIYVLGVLFFVPANATSEY